MKACPDEHHSPEVRESLSFLLCAPEFPFAQEESIGPFMMAGVMHAMGVPHASKVGESGQEGDGEALVDEPIVHQKI